VGDGGLSGSRKYSPMSTGTASAFEPTVITRRVPRFKLTVPLALIVLRSGIPDRISGHTLELGEGGLGVRTASELVVGESVRVEFLVPHTNVPVRATAVVRYQRDRCFGLQFLRLPAEQQSIICYWTRREGELVLASRTAAPPAVKEVVERVPLATYEEAEGSGRRSGIRRIVGFITVLILLGATLAWWRWQQGWNELEAVVPNKTAAVTPQLKVPAEEMEQRIVHKFLPEYPQSARRAGMQGTVVLDAIVGAQGDVEQVKLISGPEALAQPAMEAVRWWRYQPYLANGRPVAIETTVQLDFRLGN
jgi:TonB family protein